MASQTTNLKLVKPAANDNIDISQINGNMDKIDTAVKAVQDSISSNHLNFAPVTSGSFDDLVGPDSTVTTWHVRSANLENRPPVAVWYWVFSFALSTYTAAQIAVANNCRIFRRRKESATWGPWSELSAS